MALKYVENDILNAKHGFIVHQVNNKRVMGAGLAKQIRAKFPRHYLDYQNAPLYLGNVIVTPVRERTWVVGLVAQNGYGRDGKCYTDYEALKDCLESLSLMLTELYPKEPVLFPYGIGCGLAGGDWKKVEPLIETYFPSAYIVKLKKGDTNYECL